MRSREKEGDFVAKMIEQLADVPHDEMQACKDDLICVWRPAIVCLFLGRCSLGQLTFRTNVVIPWLQHLADYFSFVIN